MTPTTKHAVFGTLQTECNTSRGKNFEQSGTPSTLFYNNYIAGMSSSTETTPPWSLP
jgi:hypothetical protein